MRACQNLACTTSQIELHPLVVGSLVMSRVLGLVLHLAIAAAQAPSLEQLLETLRQHPDNPAVHNNLGTALKARGDLAGAIEHMQQSIALDPFYAKGYNNLGNAWQAASRAGGSADQMERAAELHRWAVKLQPTMASAYNSLGNALRALEEPAEAVSALSVAVKLNQNSPTYYSNLGAASLALHKLKTKEAYLGAASGDGPQATREAAAALEAAVRWLRVAEGLAPTDVTVANNLAAALEADGQLGGARALFEKALAASPQDPLLHIHRANVLKGQGALHEAVYTYHHAMGLEGGKSGLAYNNLGASLQAVGSSQLALQAYTTAVEMDPHDQTARDNLNKLPISPAYKSMAAYETRVLRMRAAAAVLAARGARRASAPAAAELPRSGSELLSVQYYRTIRYLRRLETEQAAAPDAAGGGGGGGVSGEMALWRGRAEDMSRKLEAEQSGTGSSRKQITLGAFAWGGVWLHSFASAFTHAEVRSALLRASRADGVAVVLGSSLGFEAYLPALVYGVRTVGVELLCGLQSLAEQVRVVHGVSASLARFECADALEFSLPAETALVYVDDTAWDDHAVAELAAKLAGSLPQGAVVVHNSQVGYATQKRFKLLETREVACSWNSRHPVLVHLTQGAPSRR